MPFRFPRLHVHCIHLLLALLTISVGGMLYLPGAGSALLYLTMVVFVVCVLNATHKKSLFSLNQTSYLIPILVISVWWLIAVMSTQIYHGTWHASGAEKALRALCLVPVILLFINIPSDKLRHIQWAFMLAAVTGAASLIVPPVVFEDGSLRPNTAAFALYNTVGHANLVMLFTCLTIASLGWCCTRFKRTETGIKLLIVVFGFWGVIESQTRSSLLALPAFALIAILAMRHVRPTIRRWLIGGAAVLVVALSFAPQVRDRVELARVEIEQCSAAPNSETSVCIRFQLLRAAKHMIADHPLFGAGDGKLFVKAMHRLGEQQVISPFVAKHWGETHNDISFVAAAYGLFGVIPFTLCFFVLPAWIFTSRLHGQDATARTAAIMGLLIVTGFLSFGLTEAMYRSMRTISVYVVLVGLMIAMSRPESHRAVQSL